MLSVELIDSLFPADLPSPSHWESRYPARTLPAGSGSFSAPATIQTPPTSSRASNPIHFTPRP